MKKQTRRAMLVALAAAIAMGVACQARAADQSARDFLAAIYNAYKGKDAKGITLDAKTLPRYFEPSLVQAINKDRNDAAKRREVGKLDGDPFVDAQDWDIDTINIAVRATGPDKATGTVSFKNGNKPVAILVFLVKLNDVWRIHDIRWGTRRTLRKLLGAA